MKNTNHFVNKDDEGGDLTNIMSDATSTFTPHAGHGNVGDGWCVKDFVNIILHKKPM